MNNYGRNISGGNRYGTPLDLDATVETAIMSRDRSFTFVIDALDEDETANALRAATALARQIREVVIPEVDTWTYTKMTDGAGTKENTTKLTASNVYDEILKATTVLDNNEIPETERALVVTPATYELMKKNSSIVLNTDIGADMRAKGVIARLDGADIIKVPAVRLPENFDFMLSHKSATVLAIKLESYNTHHFPPGISGDLVEGRIVYDAFVLENKAKAIYTHSAPTQAPTQQ